MENVRIKISTIVGAPLLTTNSKLPCMCGGVISTVPDPPAEGEMSADNMEEEEVDETLGDSILNELQDIGENISNLATDLGNAIIEKTADTWESVLDFWENTYVGKSLDQIVRGNYSDNNTALGIIGQVEMGFFGIETPLDAVNTYHNITNWENTKEHYMKTGLDAIAYGSYKYVIGDFR